MTAVDHRAYMLDVSRDRVPTNETLDWLVDVLARSGFNELQLYVEHTFTYAGHDVVWEAASPLTRQDMGRLDARCAAAGIELVANMNGFGHMGRWLAHEEYRDRAECPDGFASLFGDGVSPPGSLAPTTANAEFAVALARDIGSTVTSRRIHIGGDEPFELGDGVSRDEAETRGRDHVYAEHLNRLISPLAGDGYEVMFWADLFRRDASLLAAIPDGAIGVVWNYEEPSDMTWSDLLPPAMAERLGLPDDANRGFASHARLFVESGTPFWLAAGTASWNTILGRNRNAAGNIADAVAVGAEHGAKGFMLCDWGDGGHWQPLAVSLPSIVRAGAATLSGRVPAAAEVGATVDEIGGFSPGTGDLLDRLGNIAESIGVTSPNGSAVGVALTDGGFPVFGEPDAAGMAAAAELLEESIETFADGDVGGPRGAVVSAEMDGACRLALIGLRRLAVDHHVDLGAAAAGRPTPDDLDDAIHAQRRGWLLSSRPGGLDDSISKIRR